jgi:hypothetical protein
MEELRPEWGPGLPPRVRLWSRFVHLAGHKGFAIAIIFLLICATALAVPSCSTFEHTTERTNPNGIFFRSVRPLAAAASSRPSSSTRTTTPHCFRTLLGPVGPTIINDPMGAEGAATAACASRQPHLQKRYLSLS